MADRPTFRDPPSPETTAVAPEPVPDLPVSLTSLESVLRERVAREAPEKELPPEFLAGQQRVKFIRWTYLEATDVLQARLDRAIERLQDSQIQLLNAHTVHVRRQAVQLAHEIVADGAERDEARIAMQRPQGCWCFGLGGRDEAVVSLLPDDAVPISQWEYKLKGQTGNYPLAVYRDETVFGLCCPYCTEGQEAAERKWEIMQELERGGARALPAHGWVHSGIPIGFQGFRLETWPNEHPSAQQLLLAVIVVEPSSWCFIGEVGRGKTGLAIGMAWEWREKRKVPSVLFQTHPALMQEIKASFDSHTDSEVIRKYADAPFLILDDMGAGVSTSVWSDGVLYQIIGDRHSNNRPTIFTSNKTPMELAELLQDRVYERMVEMCSPGRMIEIKGPNLRERRRGRA